jgi:hypothetical protein
MDYVPQHVNEASGCKGGLWGLIRWKSELREPGQTPDQEKDPVLPRFVLGHTTGTSTPSYEIMSQSVRLSRIPSRHAHSELRQTSL